VKVEATMMNILSLFDYLFDLYEGHSKEKRKKRRKHEIFYRESMLINNPMMSTMQVQKTINIPMYIYLCIYIYGT
jgi:hypothetical protein